MKSPLMADYIVRPPGYKRHSRDSQRLPSRLLGGLILLLAVGFWTGRLQWAGGGSSAAGESSGAAGAGGSGAPVQRRRLADGSLAPTLVVYVFSNTGAWHELGV